MLLWSLVLPRGQCGCGSLPAMATEAAPQWPKDLVEDFYHWIWKLFFPLSSYCLVQTLPPAPTHLYNSTWSMVTDWRNFNLYFSFGSICLSVCYFLSHCLNFISWIGGSCFTNVYCQGHRQRQTHCRNNNYALHTPGALQFWKFLHLYSREC